ncbi:MAG: hypothetical protein AB7H80_05970, partial [Candidatus Kapaibacterium sp.]
MNSVLDVTVQKLTTKITKNSQPISHSALVRIFFSMVYKGRFIQLNIVLATILFVGSVDQTLGQSADSDSASGRYGG